MKVKARKKEKVMGVNAEKEKGGSRESEEKEQDKREERN